MLRLTLSRLLLDRDEPAAALLHLEQAVKLEPGYTAAWKSLGKTRLQLEDPVGAAAAWENGLAAARANGDKQAEREMTVFLKRLAR